MSGPTDIVNSVGGYVPAWLESLLLLLVGVALAYLLHGLLWRVATRMIGERRGLAVRIFHRLKRPSRLALVLVVLIALVNGGTLSRAWERGIEQAALAILFVIFGWAGLIAIDTASERAAGKLRLDAEDNLSARKQITQIKVVQKVSKVLVWLLTAGFVLSTFEAVRQYGVSLFASAGAAGLVLGFAARPVLTNLIAGIQIALTQPIRMDDVVIVEGEWGWIEEIASTYVVVRIWDLRRLVVPLSYFIEQPFQNWTRENANIIGSVFWFVDYKAPIAAMRAKLQEFVEATPLWDGKVVNLQVTESERDTVQVRALVSARTSPRAWDLRCEIREKMIEWLKDEHPEALPRERGELMVMRDRDEGPGPRFERETGVEDAGTGIPREARPG
ncbi:mechanosensitive ion channel family protein [Pelagovum pacificum]|uniref:Mechanosensitive ion channel family protein n=1 Tax=Pelagovum pacificum TaxID=2588711 RepID=A0A5C5GFT8_9RHOB|nr:mechanosensitive ion channel family protein [Pelagovum pacificum]QQA43258.1 mechanosensitive ion channel family protein [Pelagovum pacificum]TNY33605.1 mechanosensitive ion channel family protein [Pelagovum pacificum]